MTPHPHLRKVCVACQGVGIKPKIGGLCDQCHGSGQVLMQRSDFVEQTHTHGYGLPTATDTKDQYQQLRQFLERVLRQRRVQRRTQAEQAWIRRLSRSWQWQRFDW